MLIRGGHLLNVHHFQPDIFSKFIFHQQIKEENTALTLYQVFTFFMGGGGGAGVLFKTGCLLSNGPSKN